VALGKVELLSLKKNKHGDKPQMLSLVVVDVNGYQLIAPAVFIA
jgi:hypothetical protein